MARVDPGSTEFFGSGYPDGAIREQMDRQQHDSDQEQNPGNLDCHRGYPGHIQCSGNDSNHQEHQCVVQHSVPLSIRRFPEITESSMDPQFTHLTHFILRSRLSRTLATGSPHSSITRNPPHRAQAISPPLPLYSRAVDAVPCQTTIGHLRQTTQSCWTFG